MEGTQGDDSQQDWYPYEPSSVPEPGYTLRETLEALGMSQSKLASRTGLTLKHINQIIQGNAAISPATAIALERATGVNASFWNNLESQYQDYRVRAEEAGAFAADSAEWIARMPVTELRKRGYIAATMREPGRLLQELLTFFGVGSISAWETSWDQPTAAFLQSSAYTVDPAAVSAWLRLGELATVGRALQPFDRAGLRSLLPELRTMTVESPDVFYRELVNKLSLVGVCLVLVPDVPGTRASGATRFLSPSRAVIQLSNRGKRNDKFWFALFHEIAHLLLHSKKETFMRFDDAEPDGTGAQVEQEANAFAEQLLIPLDAERDLLDIKTPADAKSLATRLGIAPAIVAGRFQRETKQWAFGRTLFETYEIKESASGR